MTVRFFTISILVLSTIPELLADIYVYEKNRLVEDYDDQPSGFGPSFPIGGIKGYVVLTSPKNACTKVDPPPNVPISNYKWIALIPRTKNDNSCDFDLKVKNAQDANFSAVIIYNYDDALITMGTHGRSINISSTLISLTDGLAIISNYVYNQSLTNPTPTFLFKLTTEQMFKFGAYIIPFVCVIGVSFLGLICFMIVKCYIHRRRSRRHRLPRSALKQLKVKKFVKGDRWEVCAICLDDFEDGAKLRILPCDHAYHMKCIDPWLLNNRRQCPVCKRYVFPNQDNSDEEESSGHAATERTPLIRPSDDDPATALPAERFADRRLMTLAVTGAANFNYPINDSSETEGDDTHDESSPPRASSSHITTTDLVFEQPQSHPRRYPPTRLPRILLRQSSTEENDTNDASIATAFESLQDSTSVSFTTPHAPNFFVGSLGGTTDNTNISTHSVIEDPSDNDTDDNDERMHSVLTDVEINPAYVPDEESADGLHTTV